MNPSVSKAIKRSFLAALIILCLTVGYAANVGRDATTERRAAGPVVTKKLSASDLLLAAATATGIHLRYQGITNGPLTADHANDIPISSFQFGVARGISAPGGGTREAGLPSFSEVTLTHTMDAFSVPLLGQAIKGSTPANATLYFTNLQGPGGTPLDYLEIFLGKSLISSYSMSSGGDNPSESLSINYTLIQFKYRIAGTSTVQVVGYDLQAQRAPIHPPASTVPHGG